MLEVPTSIKLISDCILAYLYGKECITLPCKVVYLETTTQKFLK